MENLFLYFVKTSGLIGLFYLSYMFLLRKETFFSANRWFLLSGLLTSALLPLYFITKIIWVEPLEPTTAIDWSNVPVTTSTTNQESQINWYLIATYIYLIGTIIFLLKLLFDFYSLSKVLKNKKSTLQDNFKLIEVTENIAPFSFFKTIVYNSSLYSETELTNILEHEKVHSSQYHSVDVLVARLFCTTFWFNPLIWLYKKAMVQNLEFIADSEASKNIADKKAYQLTLLKITTQDNCVAITNHFYQSLIKKRIIMLNKNQSNKWNSWKYITVFPALIAFIFLFQIEVVAQEKETPKQVKENKSDSVDLKSFQLEKDLKTLSENKEIIINGEKSTQEEMDKLNPDDIEKVDVATISGKKTILVTTKHLSKPVKITDKTIYIDGIKSTNEDFNKLDQSTVDKVDVNTFENTIRITTKNSNKLKQEEIKNKESEPQINKIDFIITKNTTDEEIKEKCNQIKNLYNIDLSFFNIKRNNNGEIINIESKYKNIANGNNGYFTTSRKPIEPFKFYSEKITLGSTSGHATGYASLSNSINRIINDQQIDYKKAVIVIDGKHSDYQTLEKLSPNDIKQVIKKDINSRWPENKKYYESYGEKALYGFLIEVKTNEYYNQHN